MCIIKYSSVLNYNHAKNKNKPVNRTLPVFRTPPRNCESDSFYKGIISHITVKSSIDVTVLGRGGAI